MHKECTTNEEEGANLHLGGAPMTETRPQDPDRLSRYWPFAAGGFLGPILAFLLGRWWPPYAAEGGGLFVAFFAAMWLFDRQSGHAPRFARNLLASAAGGLMAGLVAYLLNLVIPRV
jgi:hypothetical protein